MRQAAVGCPRNNPRMSRWTTQTTPEQKQACIRALMEDDISAPRVAALAAAGQLADLGPFQISASACRRLRAAERLRRERDARLSPENWDERYTVLQGQIIGFLEDGVTKIAKGEAPETNLVQARNAMRLLNELRAGPRTARRTTTPKPSTEEHSTPEPTTSGALHRLGIAGRDTEVASSARVVSLHVRTRDDGGPAA